MKCRYLGWYYSQILLLLTFAIITFRCNESLPGYVFPTNVLSLKIDQVEQEPDRVAPPGRQAAHFRIVGQNIYDEVFQDSVNIKGTMRIWWENSPDLYKTFTLTAKNVNEKNLIRNGKMTLLPGQKFSMDFVWNLRTDGNIYIVSKMNFVRINQRQCEPNVACSDPEIFVVEASLNVFDKLGFVSADPVSFELVGKTCITCGRPPCPTPSGFCE